MTPRLTALALLIPLAACGGGLPPSIDAAGIETDRLTGIRFNKLAHTAPADLPAGAARFSGRLGSQITGDYDGRMIGDLDLRIDFDTNSLSGDVSNINITDRDGEPTQRLGGRLDLSGATRDGVVDAQASGTVRILDDNDITRRADLALALDGHIRTQDDDGDAVAGTMTGTMSGDVTLRLFDGYFYGVDNDRNRASR